MSRVREAIEYARQAVVALTAYEVPGRRFRYQSAGPREGILTSDRDFRVVPGPIEAIGTPLSLNCLSVFYPLQVRVQYRHDEDILNTQIRVAQDAAQIAISIGACPTSVSAPWHFCKLADHSIEWLDSEGVAVSVLTFDIHQAIS